MNVLHLCMAAVFLGALLVNEYTARQECLANGL